MKNGFRWGIAVLILFFPAGLSGADAGRFSLDSFLDFKVQDQRERFRKRPKTLFQTNLSYQERIAIPVDGVIVHRHGAGAETIAKILRSWAVEGYLPQRMFFADSDAGNHYTQGRFDGRAHFDEIERDRSGKKILCSGIRPYMLPTEGWSEYLKTQVKCAIDGGARAVYPEEPLAHNFSGYELSFKKAFAKEYGIAWRGGHESADAFFKTGRLKNKLYIQLEQELLEYTKEYARKSGQAVEFYIPIHSLFSNLSAHLIAPLGTSLRIDGHQGYIGQIWTGPVRWTMSNYGNKDITFFDSAYLNYNYFVNLVDDSPYVVYLLGDPVEDNPSYRWDEYGIWYKECLAAMLMFPTVNTYEVMPWPDRIFLPGYGTGGGSPGPGRYLTILMSVITALQDMPRGRYDDVEGGTKGIGMLVGDSAMWQNSHQPVQDPLLGLLMPVLRRGVPISSVPIERSSEVSYIDHFKLLLLSYEAWKPELEAYHDNLVSWVRRGGALVIFDTTDAFDDIDMFWRREGFGRAQEHLLSKLGITDNRVSGNGGDGGVEYFHKSVGAGHLVMVHLSPKSFVDNEVAAKRYLPLLRSWVKKYLGVNFDEPQFLCVRRGDFLIAHTFGTTRKIEGKFIDIYDENLSIVENITLRENTSVILLDITQQLQSRSPKVLYATYRLMGKKEEQYQTTFFIQGPAKTEGRVRLFGAGKEIVSIQARNRGGTTVSVTNIAGPDGMVLVKFPYNPEGTGFKVVWK